jgi:hypothetical protein
MRTQFVAVGVAFTLTALWMFQDTWRNRVYSFSIGFIVFLTGLFAIYWGLK